MTWTLTRKTAVTLHEIRRLWKKASRVGQSARTKVGATIWDFVQNDSRLSVDNGAIWPEDAGHSTG
jgi:hypothetical protein